MLKGHVFSKQIFGNPIFALFINTFLNGRNGISNNYKNGMQVTYSGSNVTVDSGAVCIQGRFLEEDTGSTVPVGTDTAYCKLVIEINLDLQNTESQFNQAVYKVVKSASGYPTLTQTNIVKNNAGIYQYELARFRTNSSGISEFQDMRTFLNFDSIFEEIRQEYGQVLQELQDELASVVDGSDYLLKSAGGTVQGKIVASGGIEGNVTGNVTGNVSGSSGSCTGNAATAGRLQTARNITLSGDVTGSASFNGSSNVNINTDLANIAVLTGTMSNGSATISYPNGYNKDNCVVISIMLKRVGVASTRGYSSGTTFLPADGTSGSISSKTELQTSSIILSGRHLYLSDSGVTVMEVNYDIYYKIVLMKI